MKTTNRHIGCAELRARRSAVAPMGLAGMSAWTTLLLAFATSVLMLGCGKDQPVPASQPSADIVLLKKNQRDMQEQMAAVLADLRDLDKDLRASNMKIAEHSYAVARMSELETKLDELATKLDSFRFGVTTLVQTVEALDQAAKQQAQQLADMQRAVQTVQSAGSQAGQDLSGYATQDAVRRIDSSVSKAISETDTLENELKSLRDEVRQLTLRVEQAEGYVGSMYAQVNPAPIRATSTDIELQYLERVHEGSGQLDIVVEGTLTNTTQGLVSLVELEVKVKHVYGYSQTGQLLYSLSPRLAKKAEYRNLRPGESRRVLAQIPYKHLQSCGADVDWRVELQVNKEVRN